jgi:hypothetical protein
MRLEGTPFCQAFTLHIGRALQIAGGIVIIASSSFGKGGGYWTLGSHHYSAGALWLPSPTPNLPKAWYSSAPEQILSVGAVYLSRLGGNTIRLQTPRQGP